MDAAELTDDELLAALAPLSLRSTLDTPSAAASMGRGIVAATDVQALVDQFERGLFASPVSPPNDLSDGRRREVAASVAFQAVVGQVANPVLLAAEVLGVGIAVEPADVRWRADGWAVRYGLAAIRRIAVEPRAAVIERLGRQLVGPWAASMAAVVPLPDRLLRGNAAAAIHTALDAVDAVAGSAPSGPVRRDSCCLIHLAGLAPCTECPMDPSAS